MQEFTFYSPTKVIFGRHAEDQAVPEIRGFGGNRVIIVYGGGSVIRSGLLPKIQDALSNAGMPYTALGGVKPNPRLSLAREGVKQALEFQADFVLAVGGGSVIDTAKAIAHGAANPGTDIWDFWLRRLPVEKSLPVGAVLTISAAGSETSDSSVITDEESGCKRGLSTEFNRPKFACMNPELTYTLPRFQITCGVVDIMMHTLDRYFTHTTGNNLTDEFAEGLLRNTIHFGRIAPDHPTDYEAMSELMWSGSISHNGLTGLGAQTDFAPHQLGHELSAMFDVAHGASLSAIWGSWARYSYQYGVDRFVRYADKVWDIRREHPEDAALAGIQATEDYFRGLGMPTCFSELGIGTPEECVLRELADRCVFGGARTVGSFRPLKAEDTYAIYKMANH